MPFLVFVLVESDQKPDIDFEGLFPDMGIDWEWYCNVGFVQWLSVTTNT